MICAYCQSAIDGPPYRPCRSCSSPHHIDCWAEYGGCAIPGCAGAPQAAVSQPPPTPPGVAPPSAPPPVTPAPGSPLPSATPSRRFS